MSSRVPKGKLSKKEFTREMWRICNRRTFQGCGGILKGPAKKLEARRQDLSRSHVQSLEP